MNAQSESARKQMVLRRTAVSPDISEEALGAACQPSVHRTRLSGRLRARSSTPEKFYGLRGQSVRPIEKFAANLATDGLGSFRSSDRPAGRSALALASLTTLFLMTLLGLVRAFSQGIPVPENPLRGRVIFEQKGCITCHAVKGDGGKVGPDLGEKMYYGTFLDLASVLWNHVPTMVRRMRELDLPFPVLEEREMSQLVAFLYYLRYLGEPGNLYRGKILLRQKGCLSCHSIGGKGGKVGPAFDALGKFVSPLYLAQALWNHGPAMWEKMKEMGLKPPRFESQEIVDLSAYIREATLEAQRTRVYMTPGNPKRGEKVFERKGCPTCHAVNGRGGRVGPDLGKVEWRYTVTEIAGLMWNHAVEMGQLMEERSIAWPKFNGQEMADLIAYLYFLHFQDPPGDAEAGRKVFRAKGCATCHEPGGEKAGPDLTKRAPMASPMHMASVMWNHAPAMEEMIAARNIKWPTLSGDEMRNLYAYLKSVGEKR